MFNHPDLYFLLHNDSQNENQLYECSDFFPPLTWVIENLQNKYFFNFEFFFWLNLANKKKAVVDLLHIAQVILTWQTLTCTSFVQTFSVRNEEFYKLCILCQPCQESIHSPTTVSGNRLLVKTIFLLFH
jgi:hypothetical protein